MGTDGGVPVVLGVVILAALLLGMLGVLRAARARFGLHAELSRKLAHVGLGLVTLSFPWLFRSPAPVLVVTGMALFTLLALRHVPALRDRFGGVVNGVARTSAGDLWFPIAAAALFVLSAGDRVLFSIPILTLAFADAVAALVGIHYGRMRYITDEGLKSLEGSIAFFVVAFFTTHVPLLLFTTTGRAESLLIGLVFGVLVMLVEAVAWRGLDNLFIPIGGFLLLKVYLHLDAAALLARLFVTLALLALVLVLRKRRTLSDTAVLAAVLIGYVSWSVGGWQWLVPPLTVFLLYTMLWPRRHQIRERPHSLTAVFAVASSGLLWLALAVLLGVPRLFYPYTVAFAANLAFIGITWIRSVRHDFTPVRAVLTSSAVAWASLFIPYLFLVGPSAPAAVEAAAALLWITIGGAIYYRLVPHQANAHDEHPWLRQATIGLAASALGLLLVPSFALP